MACYLTFSAASQGSLFMHWSEAPIDGALASFAPTKAVPKFKLTANGGRSEVARDVGGANPKRFYEAMCGFTKQARSYAGPFTFLKHLDAVHTAIYLSDSALAIVKVAPGDTVDLSDVLVVGAVPENALGFGGVLTMQTELFQQTAAKIGAAITL